MGETGETIYIIQKASRKAMQKCTVIAIEFGLLYQKLWGMLAAADVFIEHSCSL